ncbi:phosphotransferase family protein [Scatolibacter rhodanostii]|uniref:phosphotransferase family protein n=1 Tax=Scatolibacter rhodanostii TaxID=2014781 RepID=UPI000C07FACB|nr:aminoglycoside phosphotransferase family protein [Scatolibacter rhodanostii]
MPLLTKNVQSQNTLESMVKQAFPNKKLTHIQELTEGFFNIAYAVVFDDGTESVLKIAPHPDTTVIAYEKNIMATEVACMKIVAEKSAVPLPKVQFSDFSCALCNAPYFFMEKIEGKSFSTQKDSFSAEEISYIYHETGKLNKQINAITNNFFGYPSQTEFQGEHWYDIFAKMIKAMVQNAEKAQIKLPISLDELLCLLEKHKLIFEEVKIPQLVHWDIWDGNVFVKDGKITGIIDWERCLWGDVLMEVGFRSYAQTTEFLSGYGIEKFTVSEQKRILWYDIYLLLVAVQEHVYRGYDADNGWAISLMNEKFDEIKSYY